MPPIAPTLLREYGTVDVLDMDYHEAMYYYQEAIMAKQERELREVWLAVAFPAFGNKDAPLWSDFKKKYLLSPGKKGKERKPTNNGMATFQGTDLTKVRQ